MPPLFMNTPWLGATVATNEPAGFDVERGGAKMLMGEEERAERGEEGVSSISMQCVVVLVDDRVGHDYHVVVYDWVADGNICGSFVLHSVSYGYIRGMKG